MINYHRTDHWLFLYFSEAFTVDFIAQIEEEARLAAHELIEAARLKPQMTVVVGCSTSEVAGEKVGSHSSPEIAAALYRGLSSVFDAHGIYMAAQCCEHLNRAIVIEREAAKTDEFVNVVPQPKAGGSFATAAYRAMRSPCVLEEIRADAGLDIGGTLIGMHLKRVAVPLRLSVTHIGRAILLSARTRPRFIGGVRAVYDETLL